MSSPALTDNWTVTWNLRYKRYQLITGTAIMLAIIYALPFFFGYLQKRQGVVLNDWLLARVPPHNVSVLIFTLIWGMALLTITSTIKNPSIYITFCWTYIFIYIVRFVTLSLVALNPPQGIILLTDPVNSAFYHNAVITKDLFFSGHTATMVTIFLCLEKRTDKIIALIAAIAVACLLLLQHVHYTIDVLAAPVVVYACYRLTRYLFFNGRIQPDSLALSGEKVNV
ncbi:phosphatase PAP2-related protein [Mucilaginibacter sp.]|uniref:phosphatase PAP2-related protein n=1 Tax=Mucilaginibacter sp. TaxID=1882438 RepID=UPI00283E140E|nr:phosphatase PAP2-related protein [Mucilaginibacter sp.]MDR3695682.1 phosphatase PAP2-related protein [Mucilaginibacter sp.]